MTQALDDLKAALEAEDKLIDQAVALIQGFPAVLQAAIDAAKAGNDAELATIKADVQAHADALTAALPAATPETPAVPVPGGGP